jgi:hypothetical protein
MADVRLCRDVHCYIPKCNGIECAFEKCDGVTYPIEHVIPDYVDRKWVAGYAKCAICKQADDWRNLTKHIKKLNIIMPFPIHRECICSGCGTIKTKTEKKCITCIEYKKLMKP